MQRSYSLKGLIPGGVYHQAGLLTHASSDLTHGLPSFPVTDFRHVRGLGAYSGGTVRGSHPIVYSLSAAQKEQEELLTLLDYSTSRILSIELIWKVFRLCKFYI